MVIDTKTKSPSTEDYVPWGRYIPEDEFYDRIVGRKLFMIYASRTNPDMFGTFSDLMTNDPPQKNSMRIPVCEGKDWIIVTLLTATRRQDGRISFRRNVTDYNSKKETMIRLVTRAYYSYDIKDQEYVCAVGCHKGNSYWIIPLQRTNRDVLHNASTRDKEFP